MPESMRTRLLRHAFNLFPAWWGTGARVAYIAGDFREVRVELPLGLRTRNYVGTLFGGSLFGATDPIYMIMLLRLLGPDYAVWDKAATIRYRRPGKSTVRATFRVPVEETQAIVRALETDRSVDRQYRIELRDDAGELVAEVDKTVYVARKRAAEPGPRRASETSARAPRTG